MIHPEHPLNAGTRPPKRARNTPYNWVEEKGKKEREEREKGITVGPALLRGNSERREESTPWEAISPRCRDLKAS